MTLIEAIAVLFGLACVVLIIRQNILCWPTGLVQVVLYIYIFYQAKLYSDVLLQVFFVFMQFYGWYHWKPRNRTGATLAVSRSSVGTLAIVLAAIAMSTGAWGYLMATRTDASLPYADAFTTFASLAAQWMISKKQLESWLLWIVVDIVAIGIYWQKGLLLTAGLYGVFLVLAVGGWITWRRNYLEIPQVRA